MPKNPQGGDFLQYFNFSKKSCILPKMNPYMVGNPDNYVFQWKRGPTLKRRTS